MTYTVATLELSPTAFDEIAEKLKAAGYGHAFMPGGSIDMSGIAVARGEPRSRALKRFLVFGVDRYEAAGGWQDFQASYATREEAIATPLRRWFSWAEVVDAETGECTTHDVEGKTFRIKPGAATP
jgi:hypothetical protein